VNHAGLLFLSVVGAGTMLVPSSWWLPPTVLIALLLLVSVVGLAGACWSNRTYNLVIAGVCLGAAISVWQVDRALDHRVPDAMFGVDVEVTLRITSVTDDRPERQLFIAETVAAPDNVPARRWRINWYGVPTNAAGETIDIRVDDVWQLNLRLRSLQGKGNPGGFDVAAWHLREHVDAVAYVRDSESAVLLSRPSSSSVAGWRSALAKRIKSLNPTDEFDAVVIALTLGFRDGITDQFRQLLVDTGTAHLLAISGLHIGLVTAAVFFIFKWIWGFSRWLGMRFSRRSFAGLFAVGAAVLYATLAGLSAPTIRAAGMCAVALIVYTSRRSVSAWTPFIVTLAAMVLTDVLRLLSPGMWLSFGTVALILFLHRPNGSSRVRALELWRMHCVLGLCLLPITGWFFSQGSMVAPVANLIAVPLVSFIVVPMSLFVVLFVSWLPGIAAHLLLWTNTVIGLLERWLEFCQALPFSGTPITVPSVVALIAALLAALCLCAPSGLSIRRFAIPLAIPVLVWSLGARATHELEVHVLDVGQGLATLLLTENHTVLIDTGGGRGEHTQVIDTVLPALQQLGRRELSHVIISHSDLDHAAGADELASRFPDAQFFLGGNVVVPGSSRTERCVAGKRLQLDGVEFSFLHPPRCGSGHDWRGC